MPFSNHTELTASIKEWTLRTDTAFSNSVDDFIRMAEDRMFFGAEDEGCEPIRVKQMEAEVALAFTAGVATQPSDFLDARSLTREGDTYGLTYVAPDRFENEKAMLTAGGNPGIFTSKGGNIEVAPAWTGNLDLLYYARPTGITTGLPTNAILTNYPTVYLNACLVEAYRWIRNTDLRSEAMTAYNAAVRSANNTNSKGQRSGVPKRIRPPMRGVA